MESLDQEIQDEVFVWEAAVEEAVEEADATPAIQAVALRSTALEALDASDEIAPAVDDDVASAPSVAMNIEVESLAALADDAPVTDFADPALLQAAQAPESPVIEVSHHATIQDDADYVAGCMALMHEKYPDGFEAIFEVGFAEGLFALVWGKGPISGGDEWTAADNMLMHAVFMTLEEAGIDLQEVWEDFTGDLVEKLFPDGLSTETLHTALEQNGPISGQSEWTDLDFQAFDLVKSLVLQADFDVFWQDSSLEIFNEAYPDGILELFPEGYSDEAMQALLDGNGLYSGEAEWTEEDTVIFEGLWQALQEQGIEPFADDTEFTPMPIVIDDGEWSFCQNDEPILVVCDFLPPEIAVCDFLPPEPVGCELTPPPEMVVCFPHEDMIAL